MTHALRTPAALIIALAATFVAGSAAAQLPVEAHRNQAELLPSADAQLAANKRLVFDFWREVVDAHHVEKIADYVARDFVDHDPAGASGRDAFRSTSGGAARPVKPTIDELVSIVAERDLVVLAFRRELPDLEHEGQTYTTTAFEMLRIAGGRIAERWNFTANE